MTCAKALPVNNRYAAIRTICDKDVGYSRRVHGTAAVREGSCWYSDLVVGLSGCGMYMPEHKRTSRSAPLDPTLSPSGIVSCGSDLAIPPRLRRSHESRS
jgi:hypothetical protein